MCERPLHTRLSLWQRWTCPLLAGLGIVLGSGLAACGAPPAREASTEAGPPRHVLLITVDTLRADHTSAYGYPRRTTPALEELAAGGLLFEQAVCQWPKTGASFASMFTGQYPQTTGLTHEAALRVPEGYLTLPELFAAQGFTTGAVVSNGVLSAELGWDRGFGEFHETWRMEGGTSGDPRVYRRTINAPRVNELALPMLERLADAERLFAWIHYSDPHAPYVLPDEVENPFLGDPHYTQEGTVKLERPPAQALGDRRDLKYYVAQYDANVLVADRAVGELLERAEELGILDDALVIFTADHGESLGEHDYWFEHGRLPYSPSARVPLVLWRPGVVPAGERVERPVELVDLYPTLRDLVFSDEEIAGLEGDSLTPFLDGTISAGGEPGEEPFRYAFLEAGGGSPTTHWRAVQDPRWKLAYHPALAGRPAVFELYDLEQDPLETVDVKEEHRSEARRLREVLFGWMKGSEWIRREGAYVQEQSEETEKALRALGYID